MVDFSGIRVKLLSPAALIPERNMNSAGYDLFSAESKMLRAGERAMFDLGIATEMPFGYFAKIMDRSGLAAKHGVTVLGGVIDNDYRGEWKVILLNTGDKDVPIYEGSRIAQAVFMMCGVMPINEVDELQDSERGEGGFGSTGV